MEKIWSDTALPEKERAAKAKELLEQALGPGISQAKRIQSDYQKALNTLNARITRVAQQPAEIHLDELQADENPSGSTGAY